MNLQIIKWRIKARKILLFQMNPQQSILLVTLCTITLCSAHIGGGTPYQDSNPQVYCGRSLARALAFLCFEDGGSENKRSDSGSMYSMLRLL